MATQQIKQKPWSHLIRFTPTQIIKIPENSLLYINVLVLLDRKIQKWNKTMHKADLPS